MAHFGVRDEFDHLLVAVNPTEALSRHPQIGSMHVSTLGLVLEVNDLAVVAHVNGKAFSPSALDFLIDRLRKTVDHLSHTSVEERRIGAMGCVLLHVEAPRIALRHESSADRQPGCGR